VWPVVIVAESGLSPDSATGHTLLSNSDVACTVNLFDLLMMDTEGVRNM
jgi:hypothetical protein